MIVIDQALGYKGKDKQHWEGNLLHKLVHQRSIRYNQILTRYVATTEEMVLHMESEFNDPSAV